MEETYNWRRFWCPRGQSISVDRDGFLSDPEPLRAYGQTPLKSLDELVHPGCLVLLGEPGIGKSTAISQEVARLKQAQPAAYVFAPPLQSIDSSDDLRKLFQRRALRGALRANRPTFFFLDPIDECRLRVDVFGDVLVEELRRLPIPTLRLRLVCRTAAWPESLETDLRSIWRAQGQAVEATELVFLRRRDVELALAREKVDGRVFFDQMRAVGAGPFATRPVTLRMLIGDMKGGGLSNNQFELYTRGTQRLLDETPHEREHRTLRRRRDLAEREAIAARIAAATIFARRPYIALHGATDRPDQLLAAELVAGEEVLDHRELSLGERDIEDVVNSGLFLLAGERLGWAHKTYAEFLAARYLRRRDLPLPQLLNLLTGGNGEGRVVPDLIGVAVWLADIPEIATRLIHDEANLLLKSDVVLPEVHRPTLVQRLLELASENRLAFNFMELPHFERLGHPTLAEQLKRYLDDTSFALRVRDVALDIALYAGVRALGSTYIRIALDISEVSALRERAARAVIQLGDAAQRAQLKPLIFIQGTSSRERRLRSLAIEATWPDALTVEELLAAFDTPSELRGALMAEYLPTADILTRLRAEDMPVILRWMNARESRRTQPRYNLRLQEPIEFFADAVLVAALSHVNESGVAELVAEILLRRLASFDDIVDHEQKVAFAQAMSIDDVRQPILACMLRMASKSDEEVRTRIQYAEPPIVTNRDIPWLLNRLRGRLTAAEKKLYVELVATNANLPQQLGMIIDAFSDVPLLGKRFKPHLKPIKLNSNLARQLRKQYDEIEQRRSRVREPPVVQRPDPAVLVDRFLTEFEKGNLDGFWEANLHLTVGPDRQQFGDDFERDLRRLPGWQNATSTTRERLVRAAEQYVRKQQPHLQEWIGTNTYHRPDLAAIRALLLLKNEAPDRFADLPRSVWQAWAPVAVAAVFNGLQIPMIEDYYREAPDEVRGALAAVIADESTRYEHVGTLAKVSSIWDTSIATIALDVARRADTSAKALRSILDVALQQGDAATRDFAESLLATIPPPGDSRRSHTVAVAETLLSYTPESSWAALWAAFTNDREFGRSVIEEIAHRDRFATAAAERLSEEHLGQLFTWVATEFPSATDPRHDVDEVYSPSLRDDVATWRNALVRSLQYRGTAAAVKALKTAASRLPAETYLARIIVEAEQHWRSRGWQPLSFTNLLELLRSREARLVESPAELLAVVEESLDRLEKKLQGALLGAAFLWNECAHEGRISWTPKKEEYLSDFVALHLIDDLERRGVVVNREVKIRPTTEPGTGERTDIHVDAVREQGEYRDRVTIIVETKGCWNKGLYDDLLKQVANRYLHESRVTHALYLVGWYVCAAWKEPKVAGKKAGQTQKARVETKLRKRAGEIEDRATIRPVVLDVRLREPHRKGAPEKKPRRARRPKVAREVPATRSATAARAHRSSSR
ncbi:MAG TPA: ATP-binding protein [Thermoanaerobaculia bacterium]